MPVLETLFSQETITRLGWMLVHFLWQAAAVALLLAVMLRLLRRTGANLRYAVACGALALMVVLPLITMRLVEAPGPAAEAGPPPEILPPSAFETVTMSVQQVDDLPPLESTPQTEAPAMQVPWQERAIAAMEPALPYLVLGWLAGVFGLSAWHLGGWAQLHRLKRRMARQAGDALRTTLGELATKLGVRRAVTLLESAIVEVPTVLGWLRPVILLPTSALTGLSPDQLQAILAHELAHIRRCDYLANIVQTVVEILGFYHPAVWWVSSRIRIERENCCDDLAVQVCGNSLQYAKALTSMEEMRHSRSDLALAASGGSLMARIARLLGRPAVDDRRFAWLPGLIALLLVVNVIIPTTFALTHSTSSVPESPADEAPAPMAPLEASDARIAIRFVLADVFSDGVLAPQIAEEAAGLLQRIADPAVPPTVEELRRPLAQVFSAFTPAPGRGNEFIDLLGRTNCSASKLSSPQVTVLSGESISFAIGEPPSPDASWPANLDLISARFEAIATAFQDQNEIRLDVNMVRAYPADNPGTPGVEAPTWTLNATVLAPDNQWVLIPDNRLKFTRNGREYIQLPLILARIVNEPAIDAAGNGTTGGVLPTPPMGQIVDLGPGMGGVPATTSPQAMPILIKFSLFPRVASGKLVDRETRVLIGRIIAAEDSKALDAIVSLDSKPDVTLGEVLRTWVANRPMTPENIGILIDVLQSRGYLDGESTPEVLANNGQQARMNFGPEELILPPTDPASAPRPVTLGTFVQMTPHVPSLASDHILLEVAAQWVERVDPDDTSSRPAIRESILATAITIPFGKSTALVTKNFGESDDSMYLLLVGPATVVQAPSAEGRASNGAVTTIVESTTPDANEVQVYTEWVIAKARAETVLDRESLRLIGDILESEQPQIARELAEVERKKITLGQVLMRYVAGQSLSRETGQALIDLLKTLGLATVRSSPALTAPDGQQFELRNVSEEWFSPRRLRTAQAGEEPNLIRFEYGTIIKGTAHVENNAGVTLDMAVWSSEPEPRTDPNDLPVVRRVGTSTTVNVPENRYFSLLVGSTVRKDAQAQDAESLLVMVKPSVASPARQPEDSSAAGTRQDKERPRQVLLDARVVEMERGDLLNLGVEWSFPATQAGGSDDGGDWTKSISIGYSADSTFTKSLLTTLNLLARANQAAIVSNPQIVTLNERTAQLRSVQEEWFLISDPSAASGSRSELQRIESGTILGITPRVGDSNAITLEVSVEVSNSVAKGRDSDLPIVTRRQARNSVTVMNGGTVAVAGLRSERGSQTREIAVFITATLVSDAGKVALSYPPRNEPASSATFAKADLFDVLRQISKRFGADIAVDLSVKTHPITASLVDTSAETAIRRVLQGTPYTFKRMSGDGRPTYLVYRPITVESEGGDLLQALDTIAMMAEVPIIPDPNVQGKITAQLKNADLETALSIVLAGTPFVFKNMGSYYIVGNRRSRELGPLEGPANTGTQIHLTATFTKIPGNRTLDRDTAAEVFNLIAPGGDARPPMSLDELCGVGVDKVLGTLAGQIPAERLQDVIRLLESKGFLDRLAEPQLCILAGKQAHLSNGNITLDVCHEVLKGGQTIQLDVEASIETRTSPPRLKSFGTLEVPKDRHGLLLLGYARHSSSQTDRVDVETYFLIVRPVLLASDAQRETPRTK